MKSHNSTPHWKWDVRCVCVWVCECPIGAFFCLPACSAHFHFACATCRIPLLQWTHSDFARGTFCRLCACQIALSGALCTLWKNYFTISCQDNFVEIFQRDLVQALSKVLRKVLRKWSLHTSFARTVYLFDLAQTLSKDLMHGSYPEILHKSS